MNTDGEDGLGFESIESWDEFARSAALAGQSAPQNTQWPLRPGGQFERRLFALVATILVHVALVWVLFNRAGAPPNITFGSGATKSMSRFTLVTPTEDTVPPSSEVPTPAKRKNDTQVDLADASEAPSPEWSVRRISVALPRPTAPKPVETAPQNAKASISNGEARSAPSFGGSSGYDPYAGAAPLDRRRTDQPPLHSAQATDNMGSFVSTVRNMLGVPEDLPDLEYRIDAQARRRFIQSIKSRGIHYSLPIKFRVEVSSDGQIISANIIDRDSRNRISSEIIRMLIGFRLYSGTGDLSKARTGILIIRIK